MTTASIEERLERLEAVEQIRQLKAEYCNATDEGHDVERILAIYTPDGAWETDLLGRHEGHEAVAAVFRGFEGPYGHGQHNTTNLAIRLEGDTAYGTWHFIGLIERGGVTRLVATTYHDTYVRRDGRWLIHEVKATRKGFAELPGFVWDD